MRGLKLLQSYPGLFPVLSHALRVRGLKLAAKALGLDMLVSHALRVRGLKRLDAAGYALAARRTLYACVD